MFHDFPVFGIQDEDQKRQWALDKGVSICWVGTKGSYTVIGFFNIEDSLKYIADWAEWKAPVVND